MACPRCGGVWTKQSGIVRCKKCGHVSGSQDARVQHQRYEISNSVFPADEWERETRIGDKPGRQDWPLDFDPT